MLILVSLSLKAHSQHSAIRTTLPDGVINSLLNVKFFRRISFVLLGSGESVSDLMKVKWHSPHLGGSRQKNPKLIKFTKK